MFAIPRMTDANENMRPSILVEIDHLARNLDPLKALLPMSGTRLAILGEASWNRLVMLKKNEVLGREQ
jgi:hypothetical protein